MPQGELRRSQRLGTYDSNGRDYLASLLSWSRARFEKWLHSDPVRSHLQEWHQCCIADHNRFNDAVDWINTGPNGYFYNGSDLEEDLMLMCLEAGDKGDTQQCGEGVGINFACIDNGNHGWITQELWARTAWRIAQTNRADGQVFDRALKVQPAAAYGFTVELLCIVFHSVAFRGEESVYLPLLNGPGAAEITTQDDSDQPSNVLAIKHGDGTVAIDYPATAASSFNGNDNRCDAEFGNARKRKRAPSEISTIGLANENVTSQLPNKVSHGNKAMPKNPSSIITETSAERAENSSVNVANQLEPQTPETRSSWRDRARSDDEEVSKDGRIRAWIEGTFEHRRI